MIAPGPLFYWLIHWVVAAVALFVTSMVVPGFRVASFRSCFAISAVIGIANFVVRPVLIFLTLPLTILTLGLFTIVVDAIVLKMCAAILRDFEITSWVSAIFGAVILALVATLLHFWII